MPAIHHSDLKGLLERMNSPDKDFRFMATNDMITEIQRVPGVVWDDDNETKITNQVLGLLRDKNGEVQNLAVKCLSLLLIKIKDDRKQLVIQSLCQMLKNDLEQVRDIASIALKSIVSAVPMTKRMVDIMNDHLNPSLLVAIAEKSDVNLQLESLDILTELINRIGSQLGVYHDKTQAELLKRLDSDRASVRKRAMNALSALMACCSTELFSATMSQLTQALVRLAPNGAEEAESDFQQGSTRCTSSRTLLQCVAAIIRTAGHRSTAEQLHVVIPVIEVFCNVKDDELRENCIQAFEAYIRRCPVDINLATPKIIQICSSTISYDPNYNYDETEDDAMDTDELGDDESDSAEDYSDDDDLSWKVRRASAKCLEAIIQTRIDMTDELFATMAPILVSRFNEREDSVKSDVIQAFLSLMKQIRSSQSGSQVTKETLVKMIPMIISKAAHLLREKAVKTRQIVFQMFIEITRVLPNPFADHIASFVPGVLCSMTDKNFTSNVKVDAMIFFGELIKSHEPEAIQPHISQMLPTVITAIGDSFYKIASEALNLLSLIVCVMRPSKQEPMNGYEPLLSSIYEKTMESMRKIDVDLEIKERAITCMSDIIANFGDKIPQHVPVALDMLNLKLNNEASRLICVRALVKIAKSPISINLSCIFPKAFDTLSSFLKKNSRALRVSTLTLIETVVKRTDEELCNEASLFAILNELPPLIDESDLHVSQMTLSLLNTVVIVTKSQHPIIAQRILPETLKLIRSPLMQGNSMNITLQFMSNVAQSSFLGLTHKVLFEKLVEPIYNGGQVHKQAYSTISKAIAAISVYDSNLALKMTEQLIVDFGQHHSNEHISTLILLAIGEIGRVTRLDSVPLLIEVIQKGFNSTSEDVKSAASYALGCVAVGNVDKFLPIILNEIEARSKKQYMILHSLREVIAAGQLQEIDLVWDILIKHCECQEEGTRNVVSECFGKLMLLKPEVYLTQLIHYLKSDCADKPLARATIIAAIKFTISEQPQEIDELLREHIGEFLVALEDPDINVRRVALITLNSAAYNKPSLITDLLPKILPMLYRETMVKSELIREVEMGPFKHKVDDGLDSRKAAFECMYTLLDTCRNRLDILEFLSHVETGLADHYDIKMLTYLMLIRLASLCPAAVLLRLERLIKPIVEVCKLRNKENAIKQEIEKQDELKKSALRAFEALKSLPDADGHPALNLLSEFDTQTNDTRSNNKSM